MVLRSLSLHTETGKLFSSALPGRMDGEKGGEIVRGQDAVHDLHHLHHLHHLHPAHAVRLAHPGHVCHVSDAVDADDLAVRGVDLTFQLLV